MPRQKVLAEQGDRICLKLSFDVGQRLRVYAAMARLTLSQAVEQLLHERLAALPTLVESLTCIGVKVKETAPKSDPRQVPTDWDGKDLGRRLADLEINQKAFALKFGHKQQNINRWARYGVPPNRTKAVGVLLRSLPWPPECATAGANEPPDIQLPAGKKSKSLAVTADTLRQGNLKKPLKRK